MSLPQVGAIESSIGKLSERLTAVDVEQLAVSDALGRVLRTTLCCDRDSPPLSVSAMDGYAIRITDLVQDELPVLATTAAGHPPAQLPAMSAVRIFTGAPVPEDADCVVKREDTEERSDRVKFLINQAELAPGKNIRRQGENKKLGESVLPTGTQLDSAAVAALASFSAPTVELSQPVRVMVLNTGDELAAPGESVEPWQIRDSNGPMLETWLRHVPWIEFVGRKQVGDQLHSVCEALESSLGSADAILLTGGVSMGDTDYVPQAIQDVGGEIVFHRLPLRPGKPVLGAAAAGKLILGLPGNPVSVAVTSRVFGLPLLEKLAGKQSSPPPLVELHKSDSSTLDLTWFRLVRINTEGKIELVPGRGSGDLVSLALSHGFIEVPPGQSGPGPWPFRRWDC